MKAYFQSPEMLSWLVAVASVVLSVVVGGRRRRAALVLLGVGADSNHVRLVRIKHWGAICALTLIVLALARPAWRPIAEPLQSEGRDVVFVLDVSRSMLARDRQPDRLVSAKVAIGDLVDSLRPGDRAGLVVFAGSSQIVCPLTTDLLFFRKALEEAGPSEVAFGGTRIGDALRKAADKLVGGSDRRGLQDVILITDGGDQDSEISKAVEALNDRDAALLVVGVGSDSEGARIPDGDRFLAYRGREVWSRQEAAALEQTAVTAKNGLYLNAGTRAIDLPDLYRSFTEHSASKRTKHRPSERREEEFPWFLGAALVALLIAGGTFAPMRKRATIAAAAALSIGALANKESEPKAREVSVVRSESDRFVEAARVAKASEDESRFLFNAGTSLLNEAASIDAEVAKMEHLLNEVNDQLSAEEPKFTSLGEDDEAPPVDTAEMLQNAVHLFETALRRMPNFPEASRNLEIARARWLKAVNDRERKESEGESAEKRDLDMRPTSDGETGEDAEAKPNDGKADQAKSGDLADTPSDTTLADLLNRNIPAPNVSPQDVLQRELDNSKIRSSPAGPKAKAVEKNW